MKKAKLIRSVSVTLGASVLSLGLLAGCTEQDVSKTDASPEVKEKMTEEVSAEPTEKEVAEVEAEESAEETAKVAPVKIGDTLNVDGLAITLTDIGVYKGEINQYEPLTQDHAVRVGVIVENTAKESKFIDALEFTLYDADGFELTHALASDETGVSAVLPGGKKVKGSLFFDVPKQDGTWEVHYENMTSANGDPAIWQMGAK